MSNDKKKSTKKIVIIAVAAVLAVGIGTTAFLLAKDKLFKTSSGSDSETKKTDTAQTYSEKTAALSNGEG